MQQKLIIWDFDGVVADTEKIWLNIELNLLNKYCRLDWDFATINHYLSGQALVRQIEVLTSLNITPPSEMWDECIKLCSEKITEGFERTPDINAVLSLPDFRHILATGGNFEETCLKLKAVKLEDIFPPSNIVTIDMVKHGKPAPDTFLLAAEIAGFNPSDCFVIEDSIAGLTAAFNAKMTPIAFIGSEMYRHNAEHLKAVKSLGVKHIFADMSEIKNFFQTMS